ncbi:MAG TPA: HAD hydrolase family protein [Vicinamibacterales bacterium]|nr:HAD hydrolase family protein [Vicinamibacterales bacterium]
MTVAERVADIRLLLFDVDGVLTDGVVLMHADGSEAKGFHIRDGAAMVWAQRAGLTVGWLSARTSGATTHRAAQLAIRLVVQGANSKLAAYERILRDTGFSDNAVAYMGDDLLDLPVLTRAGLSAAPADAAAEVLSRVHWVSTAPGGRGAVRQFIEMVLRAQNRWDTVLREYVATD